MTVTLQTRGFLALTEERSQGYHFLF